MAQGEYVVRCRGLPWSCGEQELKSFFGYDADVSSMIFTYTPAGKATGEAYVAFDSEVSYKNALKKDKERMGKRYIEVFNSTKREMEYAARHSQKPTPGSRPRPSQGLGLPKLLDSGDLIVRMRGLPFGCWEDDIIAFFSDLQIVPDGVLIVKDKSGRQSGDGFVQFADADSYQAALSKDRESIGHRYIEIFPSSYLELEDYVNGGESHNDIDQWIGGANSDNYGRPKRMKDSKLMGRMGMNGGGARYAPYPSYNEPGAGIMGGSGYYGVGRNMAYTDGDYLPSNGNMMMAGGGGIGSLRAGGMTGPGLGIKPAYPAGGMGMAQGKAMAGAAASGSRAMKHSVFIRGLPYKCGQEEIVQFFQPLRLSGVQFLFDAMGRPSGEAKVEFFTVADAQEAMTRNRTPINGHVIELYFDSETAVEEQPPYMASMQHVSKPAMGQAQEDQYARGYTEFTSDY